MSGGHQARKRFGQNFLQDPRVISDIVSAFKPMPGQQLVEIGPGLGALTFALLAQTDQLHVIELDRDLVKKLQRLPEAGSKLMVHEADALKFDYSSLTQDGKKLRIIGNLPYNISTPLLFHLLSFSDYIEDMMFMLQKEVVQRMLAAPGGNNYGRLSVMLQQLCEMHKLVDVPPTAFRPVPRVESAVVSLRPHSSPVIDVMSQDDFSTLVSTAFRQRRKTLRNNLRGMLDSEEIQALDIDPSVRAEVLDLQQFADLANRWSQDKAAGLIDQDEGKS